jgi:hypothetical protein
VEEIRNSFKVLVRKTRKKFPLEISRFKREVSIKMYGYEVDSNVSTLIYGQFKSPLLSGDCKLSEETWPEREPEGRSSRSDRNWLQL